MFIIKGNNIRLTRGDNAEVDLRVFNKEGQEVEILPSDIITMTVKKTSDSSQII